MRRGFLLYWLFLAAVGQLAYAQTAHKVGPLQAQSNLADVDDPAAARSNLGLPSSATTDTTNATNITSGTLSVARLPDLSAATTTATGGKAAELLISNRGR